MNFAHPTPSYGQATPNPSPAATVGIGGFHLVSPTEGWVWIDHLYWTKDAGQSWTDITPPIPNGLRMLIVTFVDNHYGAAILASVDASGVTYAIARTQDGGKTWENKTLSLFPSKDYADAYFGGISLQLLNANIGWLRIKRMSSQNVDIGTVFKTTDGGLTWTKINLPRNEFNAFIGDPVYFVTEQLGWIVYRGNALYRTDNGGQTWDLQSVGPITESTSNWSYELPQFANDQDGILPIQEIKNGKAEVEIYATSDKGQTWKLAETLDVTGVNGVPFNLAVAVIDKAHFIISLPQQTLRVTNISTSSSVTVPGLGTSNIIQLDFISDQAGLALSEMNSCTTAMQCGTVFTLFYTGNGGQTWKPLVLPSTNTNVISSTITTTKAGFDIACLPSAVQMGDWQNNSHYSNVGIYLDGPAMSDPYCKYKQYAPNCGQPQQKACNDNLTADNLVTLSKQINPQKQTLGWGFIPVWFGPQADCNCSTLTISTQLAAAYGQGVTSANYAADAAVKLGLSGSVIYYDLETYYTPATYEQPARALISGWTNQLHARGFKAGIYTTTSGGHIADFVNIANAPDVAWIAQWFYSETNPPDPRAVYDASVTPYTSIAGFDNRYWPTHQRIYQYEGTNPETYGSTLLSVDCDAIDGVVGAQIVTPGVPTIISPANGAVFPNTTTTVTFIIQAGTPTYVGVMNWWLQVATDQNFTNIVYGATANWSTSSSIRVSSVLNTGTTYYARALQGDGLLGGTTYSPVVTLSIAP